MLLLNLGCGNTRPGSGRSSDRFYPQGYAPWINIDNLHVIFSDSSRPERSQLDRESNYLNVDLSKGSLPFKDNYADGILASHFFEHLDCQESLRLMRECYRVLRPGGVFRVVVPDPKLFHELTLAGRQDWGEPYDHSFSFMEIALFFKEHKQLLSIDSLFCFFWMVGFRTYQEVPFKVSHIPELCALDNRPVFSLHVEAVK
jgi:SAM-dependent methyltransferase